MFGLDFWNVFHHLSKMETIMPKFLEPMLCSVWTFLLHLPHFKIALFFLICCHEPISNLCDVPIFCFFNCCLYWLQTYFSPSHTISLAFKSLVGISAMDCGNLQGHWCAEQRRMCRLRRTLARRFVALAGWAQGRGRGTLGEFQWISATKHGGFN